MTEHIVFGSDKRREVRGALNSCALIVTDENLKRLYPDYTQNAFVISAGESSKDMNTVLSVIEEMSARSITRSDCVAAFGGGVVGDITGLAAALYMRGIDWVSVPTSLLAMVDSGIGGKTAVDFNGEKNLIGAFRIPKQTVISYDFTETLPAREWTCGIGEIVKTCLLTRDTFDYLLDAHGRLAAHERGTVYAFAEKCVAVKSQAVESDPTDKGLRRVLNVGHTVGHALESADGFKLTHGEYVMKGILTEITMFRDFTDKKFYMRIAGILNEFTTPPRTSGRSVLRYALHDKKNDGGKITVMLPVAPGEITEIETDADEFLRRYDRAVKELKPA